MIKFTTCFPMVGGCPGTLASSTTKTGRHDIAELLLKVALKHTKKKINPNELLISQVGQLEL